jgi:histone H3/H4
MRLDQAAYDLSLLNVIEKFKQLKNLKGEFQLEEEAIVEYETWYSQFKLSYQAKKEVSGITGRLHTHVIKLAMILAANNIRLNITKEDMELAINECIMLLPNYNTFTMNHNKDESGQAGGQLVAELLGAKDNMLRRKELIRRHCLVIPNYAELLDKIIVSLEQADYVQQIQQKDGLWIKLTPTCLAMLDGGGK